MEKIRKPRVLLTGFTPFGGETVNPALEAVKRVQCPEAELHILEVPTVFGDSARLVTAEMDAFRPDVKRGFFLPNANTYCIIMSINYSLE